jgi:16S rRNA (guanine1516-N2)-methyltransferase
MFEIDLYLENLETIPPFLKEQLNLFSLKQITEKKLDQPYLSLNSLNQLSLNSPLVPGNPLFLDFDHEFQNFQRTKHQLSLTKDPFYRLFISKNSDPIADATAGLLSDSLHLIFLGGKVNAYERNPFIFCLIQNALSRVESPELKALLDNFNLTFGQLRTSSPVIYFDPMFPEKKKSALPKKGMQLFQSLIGHDDDQKEEALRLKSLALKRFIIKRPTWAPELLPNVNYSIETKLIRFDVY